MCWITSACLRKSWSCSLKGRSETCMPHTHRSTDTHTHTHTHTHRHTHTHTHTHTHIYGTALERVTSYKYLGIWVDEKLDFKSHVNQLVKKLRIKLGFLYRNRCRFTFPDRKRIIESVFISVLDYGDVIYGNASHSTLKTLDAVYHSALRFITGDRYGTHHCTLYNKVGWPALSDCMY